jgi:hypothetical protein
MTSATFTFTVVSSGSTAVAVTPVSGLAAPVAVGTKVADIAVTPVGWQGAASVDNPALRIGGSTPNYTLEAAAVLVAGNYSGTVTVTP